MPRPTDTEPTTEAADQAPVEAADQASVEPVTVDELDEDQREACRAKGAEFRDLVTHAARQGESGDVELGFRLRGLIFIWS